MYNHLLYLLYWLVNAAVILALGWLFPGSIQLGVNKFIPLESAIYSGFWLTFFVWSMWDLVIAYRVKLEPAPAAFMYFLLVNALGVWLVAYAAKFTGLAVAGWWIMLVAVFTDLLQRWVWKIVVGRERT